MKLLLDTHVIIWSLTRDERLTRATEELILSPENMICVSTASIWEIAIKNQKAPHICPYHEEEIQNYCERAGYEILPVRPEHVLRLRYLKPRAGHTLANHDPFDHILLAQAIQEKAMFLTHDHMFDHYDETCIYMI